MLIQVLLTAFVLCAAVRLQAQQERPTGRIRGVVVDNEYKAAGSVLVSYRQVSPNTPSKYYGRVTDKQPTATVVASPTGIYEFLNVAPGTYELCVQSPGNAFLDPCEWDSAPPRVFLHDPGATTGRTLIVDRGVELLISVADEDLVLSGDAESGAVLSLGVKTADGFVRPASLINKTRGRLTAFVRVPADRPVDLQIGSSGLDISDVVDRQLNAGLTFKTSKTATRETVNLKIKKRKSKI